MIQGHRLCTLHFCTVEKFYFQIVLLMGLGAGAPFLNVTSMETSDGSKTNWWISTSISTSNLNSTSTSLQHHQGAVGLELAEMAVEEGDLATG